MIKLKAMSVLKNGRIQVVNPWDEPLVSQVFGGEADRIRAEMDAKLANAPAFEIPPTELIKIINEYEDCLNVPHPALSSLKF